MCWIVSIYSCYLSKQIISFRFDEIQEDDIEDTILNPTDDPSPGISLADQQEILEL
jgi:hypothetical protein